MARQEAVRLAILGAGPIGLEAALYAATLKLSVRVYERGQLADHVRQWGHVRLFTPFGMNSTPLGRATLRADQPRHKLPGDQEILTGREYVQTYLERLAHTALLQDVIETETTVLSVGRKGYLKEETAGRATQPFRLLLRDKKGQERIEEAELVLDCTGTYLNGRSLGDGGIPAIGELSARPQIACGIDDILGEKASYYADRTTLVVGGGFSAATSVVLLAELAKKHSSSWIVWLARSPGTQPIKRFMNDPLRERDHLAAKANMLATRGEGHVEFHANAVVESIQSLGKEGFEVHARVGASKKSWYVDRIIANVGYEPDQQLYRELHVHECYATFAPMKWATALAKQGNHDYLTVGSPGAMALQHPEPNFYILGVKSYGRSSQFLLKMGFKQIQEVFTLITGKASLDLYSGVR